MIRETELFFDEVLKNDLSLTNFVASDFTMLNGRLAKHYGIPGVDGLGVPQGDAAAGQPSRRRADDGERAEGDGQRHDHLAGRCAGPGCWTASSARRRRRRPPDVPAIEPDIRGATTIREQLAKHRQVAVVRQLPREDRPARLRPGELRRDRRLARQLPQPPATATAGDRRRPADAVPQGARRSIPSDVLPDRRDVSRTSTSSSNCC